MNSSTGQIIISKRMLFSVIGLLVMLYCTMSQPLYSSSMDNIQIIQDLRTFQSNMEARITKMIRDTSEKSCPSNWIKFGRSCYNIIAQAKAWDKASIKCLQYGAKLVEIETREENFFLKQRIIDYDKLRLYWIGGTDEISEGRFVLASTGSSLTFTDWSRGEPNDVKGQEDCIEITTLFNRTGIWNDNNCSSELYFICERTL
ncbi:C-type lectin lectoxin-Lio3-like isoform X2 [Saccostrea cucullata]|uniref:C-type lectin lectoxin-Lio3-like isoform X2 n=1 Tax=Saccostrea cuccullata TaxID=36930 RepID=UPI002ED174C5